MFLSDSVTKTVKVQSDTFRYALRVSVDHSDDL